MEKNVEMGVAGSITIALLVLGVVILMRSFYRRYTRLDKRKDDGSE